MNKELQFLIYNTPQEDIKVDVVVRDETIWLTQKAMATLFDVQVPAITKHLKNIFEEGELHEEATISKMEITTLGKTWILRLRRASRRMTGMGLSSLTEHGVMLRAVAASTCERMS
jgi:predicted transcriptional regulator